VQACREQSLTLDLMKRTRKNASMRQMGEATNIFPSGEMKEVDGTRGNIQDRK
jgi:hypothetical protein